jgi:hypothetical protein
MDYKIRKEGFHYVQGDDWLDHIPLLTLRCLFYFVASIATHSGVVLARRSESLTFMFIFVFLIDGLLGKGAWITAITSFSLEDVADG